MQNAAVYKARASDVYDPIESHTIHDLESHKTLREIVPLAASGTSKEAVFSPAGRDGSRAKI